MSITAKLKQRTKQLTADIPAVFLAMKDRRTPMLAKKFRFRGILRYQYITNAPPKLALL